MSAERFTLDTNILVYAADSAAGDRHEQAYELILRAARRDCILTVQALAEFYSVVTRKGLAGQSEADAQVRDWRSLFPVIAADSEALVQAIDLSRRRRLSFWDAMLITAAAAAGCRYVLSENMHGGGRFAGVLVLSPFAPDALQGKVGRLLGIGAD